MYTFTANENVYDIKVSGVELEKFHKMIALIKEVNGRKWNDKAKIWSIPKAELPQFLETITAKGFCHTHSESDSITPAQKETLDFCFSNDVDLGDFSKLSISSNATRTQKDSAFEFFDLCRNNEYGLLVIRKRNQ
jgi:hypothetical protein